MKDNDAVATVSWRASVDLSWRRLVIAAVVAPLPALYIGFAAFFLSFSDKNIGRVARILFPEALIYIWGFGVVFALIYFSVVSRLRGRVGFLECLVAGAVAAFLLAESFFLAVEINLMGPLPTMILFPGFFIFGGKHLLQAGALLGIILAPAGALSGWIFWRIGVAPAKIPT